MKKAEAAAVLCTAALILLLYVGIQEGLWAFLSLVQTAPFFVMGGIVSVLIWGFRQRIERLASSHERFPVERLLYHGVKPRARVWLVPTLMASDALLILIGAWRSWQTVVGYVCNGRSCGYVPIVTFDNAFSIALVAFSLILFRWAFSIARTIRRARISVSA